jgi:hypothetical protein
MYKNIEMASLYFYQEFQNAISRFREGIDTYIWRDLISDFIEWNGDGEIYTPEFRQAMESAIVLVNLGLHQRSILYRDFNELQKWYYTNVPKLPVQ